MSAPLYVTLTYECPECGEQFDEQFEYADDCETLTVTEFSDSSISYLADQYISVVSEDGDLYCSDCSKAEGGS